MPNATVENAAVHDAPRAPLAPIDASVTVPASVRAQIERAENYYKQPAEPAPQDGQQPAAAGDPAPQPAAGAPAVTAPVTQQPAAAPAPAAGEDDPNSQTWEHKYKSIHGRFTSQSQQMRTMQDQLSEMGNELMATQRRLAEVQQQEPQVRAQQRVQSLVTDDERRDFGEFIDVAAKAAQDVLNPQVTQLQGQVQQMSSALRAQAQRDMYRDLTQQVPNWRIINRAPNFLRWLGLRDQMSGAIRRALLGDAFEAADAARVIAIFQGFVSDEAASRPAEPAVQVDPAPAPVPARQPALSLEALAAPSGARSVPAAMASTEKPIYSRRDIDTFYSEVRRGHWAGRDAERMAKEHDIVNVAPREGRIR